MASRKKTIEAPSLFVVPPPPEQAPEYVVPHTTPVVSERTFRVVPPAAPEPESDVIVEPISDGRFVVSLLRDHGTTVAAVRYTRSQLEMFIRRATAALEVG